MRTSYVQLATDIFNEFTNTKHVQLVSESFLFLYSSFNELASIEP